MFWSKSNLKPLRRRIWTNFRSQLHANCNRWHQQTKLQFGSIDPIWSITKIASKWTSNDSQWIDDLSYLTNLGAQVNGLKLFGIFSSKLIENQSFSNWEPQSAQPVQLNQFSPTGNGNCSKNGKEKVIALYFEENSLYAFSSPFERGQKFWLRIGPLDFQKLFRSGSLRQWIDDFLIAP